MYIVETQNTIMIKCFKAMRTLTVLLLLISCRKNKNVDTSG